MGSLTRGIGRSWVGARIFVGILNMMCRVVTSTGSTRMFPIVEKGAIPGPAESKKFPLRVSRIVSYGASLLYGRPSPGRPVPVVHEPDSPEEIPAKRSRPRADSPKSCLSFDIRYHLCSHQKNTPDRLTDYKSRSILRLHVMCPDITENRRKSAPGPLVRPRCTRPRSCQP
jgi:hypothetical protein